MPKKKGSKSQTAAATARCDCERRCECGNRPTRPGGSVIWSIQEQKWVGRGAKEQRVAAKLVDAGPKRELETGVTVAGWQKLPSILISEWCKKEKRPAPRYVGAPGGRMRLVLTDPKKSEKDLHFCPREEHALPKETAALLALDYIQPNLPLERKLPEPFRSMWLAMRQEGDNINQEIRLTPDRPFASRYEADQHMAERKQREKLRQARDRANPPAKVYMTTQVRREICALLPAAGNSNILCDNNFENDDSDDDRNVEALDLNDQKIAAELVSQGFELSAVLNAVQQKPNDAEAALTWLMLHTPEEALPDGLNPKQYEDCVVSLKSSSRMSKKPPSNAEEAKQAYFHIFGNTRQIDEIADDDILESEVEAILLAPPVENLHRSDLIGFGLALQWSDAVVLVPTSYPRLPPACLGLTDNFSTEKQRIVDEATRTQDNLCIYDLLELALSKDKKLTTTKMKNNELKSKIMPPRVPSLTITQSRTPSLPKKNMNRNSSWWDTSLKNKIPPPQPSVLIQTQRSRLPAYKARAQVLEAVANSRVVLVESGTGAGKTTQIPQFLLEEERSIPSKVVVAQPRRLAAIGVAHRVADERGESVGQSVGFAVRGESAMGASTALLFCTTGVLLSRLRQGDLGKLTHIVVDECHERNLDGDILLALLRRYLADKNRNFQLVLMSATMDTSKFKAYFEKWQPRHLFIPGFAFPVSIKYADEIEEEHGITFPEKAVCRYEQSWNDNEDTDNGTGSSGTAQNKTKHRCFYDKESALRLAIDLASRVSRQEKDGAVLIFVATVADVNRLCRELEGSCPLHGGLTAKEQRLAFEQRPGKIVVSTNVAETSVTIPDVTVVIDTLRVNSTEFDHSRQLPALREQFIACDSAQQRSGRAGRVRSGTCYRLMRQSQFESLALHTLPEVMRVSLEPLAIQALASETAPAILASELLDPPKPEAIEAAVKALEAIGAVYAHENKLTPLGSHIATLPCAARLGKLIILGAILGSSTRKAALTIAAALSVRLPWRSTRKGEPFDLARHELRSKAKTGRSDLCLLAAALDEDKSSQDDLGLSRSAVIEIKTLRRQLDSALKQRGFDDLDMNLNLQGVALWRVMRALITAALYPRILRVRRPPQRYAETATGAVAVDAAAREIKFFRINGDRVFIHPASITFSDADWTSPWIVYNEMISTKARTSIRDATEAGIYALLLFGGPLKPLPRRKLIQVVFEEDQHYNDRPPWMVFTAHPRIAAIVDHLRQHLDTMLVAKAEDPSLPTTQMPVVTAILRLLLYDGLA
mmetsp:Transcript_14777/g.22295  ORF Transcript_14777/g.22295 Transcript_14777/m.22295 type:complete len:1277 (+) Transcript_14777:83-3913(+)